MSTTRVKDGRWRRHLEGWQGGVVALLVAALGLALGVPHGAQPPDFPVPTPDARRIASTLRQDAVQAEALERSPEVERGGTAFELRQLGAEIRRYGEADAAGEQGVLNELRGGLLRGAYNVLQAGGAEPLLQLRAYQQRIFLRELARWESTGQESPELKQVGGGVTRTLKSSRWITSSGHFRGDEGVRAAMFKRRFAEILGLQGRAEFALSREEARALYGLLLAYPPVQGPAVGGFRLRKVDELAAVDPEYPRKLGRGVALLGMGQGAAAVVELREHLAERPDGPHTLRARNYLAAAVELAEQQGGAMP